MSGLFAGGLPIVGGGGGAVAAADITDATATGIALVTAADAAAARTAIGASADPAWTAISLASSSGWTDESSAGTTATVNTGTQAIDLSYPAAASPSGTAWVSRAAPWALGAIEVRGRLSAWAAPAHADHRADLYVCGAAGANFASVEIAGDGTARVRSAAGDGAWIAVASLLGGQGWTWLVRDGSIVRGYAGVGSGGAPPTAWTYLGAVTDAGVYPATGVSLVRPALGSAGARATDVTASWTSLAWRERY